MKRILLVSHCILNNASKVEMDERELKAEYHLRNELLHLILEKNIQMLQLPCPEFIMYGSQRWGHVKNQFQHPFYEEQCRTLLNSVLMQVREYTRHPETFRVEGVVSVEGSPNCGYHLTCVGPWKGEIGSDETRIREIQNSVKGTNQPGVFMEILEDEFNQRQLNVPILTMEETVSLLKEL